MSVCIHLPDSASAPPPLAFYPVPYLSASLCLSPHDKRAKEKESDKLSSLIRGRHRNCMLCFLYFFSLLRVFFSPFFGLPSPLYAHSFSLALALSLYVVVCVAFSLSCFLFHVTSVDLSSGVDMVHTQAQVPVDKSLFFALSQSNLVTCARHSILCNVKEDTTSNKFSDR